MASFLRTTVLSISCIGLVESIFLCGAVQAQNTPSPQIKDYQSIHEIGIGLGGVNYQGDLVPTYRFQNNRPGGTLFYRRVVSHPLTVRGAFVLGFFHATVETFSDRPFPAWRDAEIRSRIIELNVGIEYYFLDYYDFRESPRWSPYFFAAPAVFNYKTERKSGQPTDPNEDTRSRVIEVAFALGPGIKLALNRYWNLGVEFGPRFVITTDYLDNQTTTTRRGQHLSNPFEPDWYFYNGINLSYTIYKQNCPDVYKGNKHILN